MKTQMNKQCLAIAIAASFALITSGTTVANASESSEHQSLNYQPLILAKARTAANTKSAAPARQTYRKKYMQQKNGGSSNTNLFTY